VPDLSGEQSASAAGDAVNARLVRLFSRKVGSGSATWQLESEPLAISAGIPEAGASRQLSGQALTGSQGSLGRQNSRTPTSQALTAGQGAAVSEIGIGYQFPTEGIASAVAISTVSTFECLSLYWKPVNGLAARRCLVRYKPTSSLTWIEGHVAQPFDSRLTTGDYATTAARQNEYRGSIVGLSPDTTYDVEMYVEGHGEKRAVQATTWSETFPIGATVTVSANQDFTLNITTGGTETGYRLYNFTNDATIGVAHLQAHCIDIATTARYVIIRGAILTGATLHGIMVRTTADAGTKPLVVIENCDISDWGSLNGPTWGRNCDSAVGTPNTSTHFTERIVVQNNRLHHPFTDSNSWVETNANGTAHPEGPQAVTIYRPTKQIVLRYNSVYSDDEHMFNDAFGSPANNFSHTGFPNADSDIYINDISHCWDDGIESEGANCNVRLWGNRFDKVFNYIANAATSIGPLYVWRSVGLRTRDRVGTDYAQGTANKNRHIDTAGAGGVLFGGGWSYWYHNTWVRAGIAAAQEGVDSAMVSDSYRNTVCKNNLLTAWSRAIVNGTDASNTWNYNVTQGSVAVASGQMLNSWLGPVVYDTAHASGPYTLSTGSVGYRVGEVIPNFTGTFAGALPDVGAIERGQTAPRFGYLQP
jgi:hypothetical protein